QMSANAARGVLDQTIDMSGKIEARAVRQVGGKVVLDGGDGTVRVSGTIDAAGKGAGQTGGRVEIPAQRVGPVDGATVDAAGGAGLVNAGAPAGKGGNWLLDPNQLTITHSTSSAADANVTATGGPPHDTFPATGNNAVVTDFSINAALSNGQNVTVTNAGGSG